MIISVDTHLTFPRELVFATYRDRIVELVSYMPNVLSIEVKSRDEKDGTVCCVNEWHGGGEIPLAARAVLSEGLLSWTEYTIWHEADFTLEWRIEPHAFTQAVYCSGKNRFLEQNQSTLIENRGKLTINPEKIHGVPKIFRRQLAHLAEEFLGKQIEPNLEQMSEGVQHYLERSINP
jgi:hypothetical protein